MTVAVSSWRTNIIKLIIHCSREPEALDGTLTTVYWETHHSSVALQRRMKSILIDSPSSLKPINDNHYFPFVHYDPHSSIKKVPNTHFRCVFCGVSLTKPPPGSQQRANIISDKWAPAFITVVSISLYHLTTTLGSDADHLTAPPIQPSIHPKITTGIWCALYLTLYYCFDIFFPTRGISGELGWLRRL